MAEKTTFIKLDRNIIRWQYYKDPIVMRVFLHLLLTANIEPHDFMGVTIGRGELATSYQKLAEAVEGSQKQVRRALDCLKRARSVAVTRHSKFSVISIENYDYYQTQGHSRGHSQVKSQGIHKATIKEYKEYKEDKERACVRENPSSSAALEAQTPWGQRGMTEAQYEAWRNQ